MSIDKYRTLTVVVETKSLTRAAAELGCTQSAVSHSIDALEKELGFMPEFKVDDDEEN